MSLSPTRSSLFAILALTTCAVVQAQTTPLAQTAPDPAVTASTMQQLIARRDDFAQKAKSIRPGCTLAPPKIEITDVPSFGNYDPDTNTLRTSAWWLLNADQKKLFFHLAGPDADDHAAQRVFEHGTYSWVFVHELGHWWQACIDSVKSKTHYQREYDANRIAAAYWRETNPALLQGLTAGFTRILAGALNPVPGGQTPEQFFNDNYATLAHAAGYIWFQARMVTDVSAETPAPSFADALSHSQLQTK